MTGTELLKNERYIEIFRKLVEVYIDTGEAVGSRSLSKVLPKPLSPATIRNVMSDLEDLGILCSEHTSSGRKPTEKGWRFFVNTLIEATDISEIEKKTLASIAKNAAGKSVESVLEDATDVLSDLSKCVSLLMIPTVNSVVKYMDFVLLNEHRAILIIVNENGVVENRLIDVPDLVSVTELEKASRYINAKLTGQTLDEIRTEIQDEVELHRDGIDKLTKSMIAQGLDLIMNETNDKIIIKGQSNLIDQAGEIGALRNLLREFDEKKNIKNILDRSATAKGVQIFIGAETKIYEMANCSMIVSQYRNSQKNMIGAIGVVGPSRMHYSRVITLVDYTAKILGEVV
jgi:heat-inducible transcriptional repressor